MKKYRLHYLRTMTKYREEGKIPLYGDETYVDKNHRSDKCWVGPDSKVIILKSQQFR